MKRVHEHGSALFYILIGVALFAALSYAVSNMMRGGSADMISEEKASVLASEILDYASQMRRAVQMMKISNGCEDTDISFENSQLAGYEHSPAAADQCKIFHASGGGINWYSPSEDINGAKDWYYSGRYRVRNIGTNTGSASGMELLMILPDISLPICEAINKRLGVDLSENSSTVNILDHSTNDKFIGIYAGGGGFLLSSSGIQNKLAGCFDYTNGVGENYLFYQVLIAR